MLYAQRPTTPIAATPQPQDVGRRIMHLALHEAVWGGAAACDVRQTMELYGHKLSGFGKYVRGGQGSGKLRMSLQLPAGDQMNSLLQVSDGELLYALENIGGKARRTRVDLGKVRERLTISPESLNDPVIAMYLAIGGQAELLRKLCQQYEWTTVEAGKLGEEPVWWLTGRLAQTPPPERALQKLTIGCLSKACRPCYPARRDWPSAGPMRRSPTGCTMSISRGPQNKSVHWAIGRN